ncbi:MAG: hypothetical protein GDA55_05445 [Cellvibrionales bacterium]|nr:hypothetical protein [Cellvibrionales bacterium]
MKILRDGIDNHFTAKHRCARSLGLHSDDLPQAVELQAAELWFTPSK